MNASVLLSELKNLGGMAFRAASGNKTSQSTMKALLFGNLGGGIEAQARKGLDLATRGSMAGSSLGHWWKGGNTLGGYTNTAKVLRQSLSYGVGGVAGLGAVRGINGALGLDHRKRR